jgi:hypothetical protein
VGRGFDAGAVADALASFIAAGGDMMALKPAGRCAALTFRLTIRLLLTFSSSEANIQRAFFVI